MLMLKRLLIVNQMSNAKPHFETKMVKVYTLFQSHQKYSKTIPFGATHNVSM